MEAISRYFTELEQMVQAISLTGHVPLIMSWSTAIAYEHVFAEQLANVIEAGDVAIGISASGSSQNVIKALGLLGAKGGTIKELVDVYVLVPGQNIEQEEDGHMILAHVITRAYARGGARSGPKASTCWHGNTAHADVGSDHLA